MIDAYVEAIKAQARPDYRSSVVADLLQALAHAGYSEEDIQRLTAARLREIKQLDAARLTKRERNRR